MKKIISLLKINPLAVAISTAILIAPMAASAYDKGDILLKFGAASVNPKSTSDDIDQIPGQAVTADSNIQVGLSGTYMLTDKIGIELLAATPFTHDIKAKGGNLGGADIGSIKQLPPTLSAQYYFMGSSSKFKPYIGAGLNYTLFFSEKTGSGAEGLGYSKLDLDNSFGFAAQIGFDYQINQKWLLNASAMYAKINTKATLSGDGVGNLDVDYDLDPMVYRINAVYKF